LSIDLSVVVSSFKEVEVIIANVFLSSRPLLTG
jgi:hypothetical protein